MYVTWMGLQIAVMIQLELDKHMVFLAPFVGALDQRNLIYMGSVCITNGYRLSVIMAEKKA